ncbi:MAG TPA: hypothetical protein VFC28_08375 [Opitutaceae bacterium]|nr:hypothetical protein [Opitutaceae bacterium]
MPPSPQTIKPCRSSCRAPGIRAGERRGQVVPATTTGGRLAKKRFLLHVGWLLAVAWCAGCTVVTTNQAACLQQAMDANHRATMGILKRANEEMLPYRIDQGVVGTSFSKDNLSLLAPADLAAWDKILCGLDAYCAALADLTSGKSSADFTNASASFGVKIQSLVQSIKGSSAPSTVSGGEAVAALGSILIKYQASRDAQAIAKAADPSFHAVIAGLIGALGFAGHPPAPVAHGLLATYEAGYQTTSAEKSAKRFKDDAITGFDAMTPAERRAAIKDFIAWLGVEQDHQDFVECVNALAAALDKAAAAHAALAQGSKETIGAAFAELRAEIQNTIRVYQKYQEG